MTNYKLQKQPTLYFSQNLYLGLPLKKIVWCALKDIFGWEGFQISIANLCENWFGKKLSISKLGLYMFVGIAWAIWKPRNGMAIQKKLPSNNPSDILLLGISFMQKWSLLLKEQDREIVYKVAGSVRA